MGNKINFLLNYYNYMESVNELSLYDDINMYQQFVKQMKNNNLVISEGLIYTYPIQKSMNIIKKRFPELDVDLDINGEIYIKGDIGEIEKYIPLFTNLGYFISFLTIDGHNWIKEYDSKTIPTSLLLEPLYDIRIDKIPEKLYHLSPLKYKSKILKYGFIPKSKNRISIHPDRIYVSDDLLTTIKFTKTFDREYSPYYKDGYCVYFIDGKYIKELYGDINLRDSEYYIIHNISPQCFKMIKEVVFD